MEMGRKSASQRAEIAVFNAALHEMLQIQPHLQAGFCR